ncbi:MAG: sarcosine oxidase subunit gamma family protein [Geminicoccaceae bacterium]
MASPKRTSALAGLLAEDRPQDIDPAITLHAIEDLYKYTLRGGASTAATVAADLAIDPPSAILRLAGDDRQRMAQLGPDEWLIVSREPYDPGNALDGTRHALVDISERLLAIGLQGSAARTVLAGGCPLDLHEDRIEPGFASRTVMGKADIVLECLAGDSFILHTNRSFMEYLWLLLVELGREHGVKTT